MGVQMATRSRLTWKPDARGYYTRHIGWERTKSGKLQQHKFLLGTDRKEAERRERKLRELWDEFEKTREEHRPLWPEGLLEVAMRIAKGAPNIPVPRGPKELQVHYTARIQRMQSKYPVICFIPEDQHAFEVGQAALEMFESIPDRKPDLKIPEIDVKTIEAIERVEQAAKAEGVNLGPWLGTSSEAASSQPKSEFSAVDKLGILKPGDPAAARRKPELTDQQSRPRPATNNAPHSLPASPTATLHQAFKRYQGYLQKEFFRHETGHISEWGHMQVRQVQNLMKHHPDMVLNRLDSTAVEELIAYWRRRPCKLNSTVPMTPKSTSNYLGTLMRFLTWLHASSEFTWTKPQAFNDYDTRIRRLPSDHARRSLEQVDTFSLDELRLLMRYGQPFDRLLLLLGLNCGFGRAEISSLLVGEVHLHSAHSEREQEILGFPTTDADSFIKRIRRKSGVYGEHILFPMTVQGLEWAIERRKQLPGLSPSAQLILNEKGRPLNQQTKGSNTNQAIPNQFGKLIKRIQDDGQEIRDLSFGKLRKTASDLIKRHSTGEIAGVFDCHGEPVKSDSLSDVYTNRPFGKVFQAIRDVQKYLEPVFQEAGPSPFTPQPQAYTKRSVIDRIIELHSQGIPTDQIATTIGVSAQTVIRHVQQHREANARR